MTVTFENITLLFVVVMALVLFVLIFTPLVLNVGTLTVHPAVVVVSLCGVGLVLNINVAIVIA